MDCWNLTDSDLGGGVDVGVIMNSVWRREGGGQVSTGATGPPGPWAGAVHLQGARLV